GRRLESAGDLGRVRVVVEGDQELDRRSRARLIDSPTSGLPRFDGRGPAHGRSSPVWPRRTRLSPSSSDSHFRSNVNSVFSGLTSAFRPEMLALPYFFSARSLASFFSRPSMVTRCSPATTPSPSFRVVSTKVPSDWSWPPAIRP